MKDERGARTEVMDTCGDALREFERGVDAPVSTPGLNTIGVKALEGLPPILTGALVAEDTEGDGDGWCRGFWAEANKAFSTPKPALSAAYSCWGSTVLVLAPVRIPRAVVKSLGDSKPDSNSGPNHR